MDTPIHVAETPTLHIAYEELGPPDAPPVILLHGWPDDARTWDEVAPRVAASGRRVIVPYLRGFGPTRFRSAASPRSGQLAALGQDVLDLADALGLDRVAVVGHDWGARAAYIAAAVAPERVTHCVALSVGWGTNAPDQALPLAQARNYWYHWFMALDRGERAVRQDGTAFARIMWDTWSPGWRIDDAAFARTARSFENPDWAGITLHSYRHRWGYAAGAPDYAVLEDRLAATPAIRAPTLVIHGGADACNAPQTSLGRERFFSGPYERIELAGVGHFPQREAPAEVAVAVARWIGS